MATKKPSLCFLTDYMVTGGLETVVCQAVDALADTYDITIMALYGGVSSAIADTLQGKARIINERRNPKEFFLLRMPVLGSIFIRSLVKERFDYLIVLRAGFLMASHNAIAGRTIFWCHEDKDIVYAEPKKLPLLRKVNRYRLMWGYRGFQKKREYSGY